mmetsp:Transcript_34938/g.100528  ORF Transcript_34938/g.100528 Transcript_34938/m.100528 type:complete len:116 (+) Transcript_34938:181-528(+)
MMEPQAENNIPPPSEHAAGDHPTPSTPANSSPPCFYPTTRHVIVVSNLLGVLLGAGAAAGGLYICLVCFGGEDDGRLFTGSKCTMTQEIGGPLSLVMGVAAMVVSSVFLYQGRRW